MIRTILKNLGIILLLSCSPAWAAEQSTLAFTPDNTANDQYMQEAKQPGFATMAADAVLARPVLLAVTILGAGLFIVTLPFTLLSNSVDQASHVLVGEPAKATFQRCLGCSSI